MKLITSKDNTIIKDLSRLLSSKKTRNDKGLFVVEGIRTAVEVLKCGTKIKSVFVTKTANEKFSSQISQLLAVADETFEISDVISSKISDTNTPQGVFCVCEIPEKELEIEKDGKYILLCSLQDPGNLGTIIRSCDAFNISGLLMTSDCPDIFSPKVLRSTMGTALRLPIKIYDDAAQAVLEMKNMGITVYAAALTENSRDLTEFDLTSSSCVMIGNEGNGLSDENIKIADQKIIIPMNEKSESLNAAIAASIFAWEMSKKK
ncbi:MAG: RNA methyltransferase [Oscillospiraceae bacterium]